LIGEVQRSPERSLTFSLEDQLNFMVLKKTLKMAYFKHENTTRQNNTYLT